MHMHAAATQTIYNEYTGFSLGFFEGIVPPPPSPWLTDKG